MQQFIDALARATPDQARRVQHRARPVGQPGVQVAELRGVLVRLADGDDEHVMLRQGLRHRLAGQQVQKVETNVALVNDKLKASVVKHIAWGHQC